MTTDTLELPRKKKPTPPPKFPGLAIEILCPLSKKNTTAVQNYQKDCRGFDGRLDELFDRFHSLVEQGPDLTLSKIGEVGEELFVAMTDLRAELVSLRWRHWRIMPTLAADFAVGLSSAKQLREHAIAKVERRFAEQKITAESFPAGSVNPSAAKHQLRHRILGEEAVLATVGHINQAEGVMHRVKLRNAPSAASCQLKWPATTGVFASATLEAARLDRPKPDELDEERYMLIRGEVGLDRSILLTPARETIFEIGEIVGPTPKPWSCQTLLENRNKKIQELLDQLPQTPQLLNIYEEMRAKL